MRAKKYHVYLTPEEKRLLLQALFDERNLLVAKGRYTDVVDELIIKTTKAKQKNIVIV